MRGASMMSAVQGKLREMGAENLINNAQLKLKEVGADSMMSTVRGKMREMVAESLINHAQVKLKEVGSDSMMNSIQEKLKQLLLILENFVGYFIAWLDKVFPPETRREKLEHWFQVVKPFIIPSVVLLVCLWCCSRCCRYCLIMGLKMMKAVLLVCRWCCGRCCRYCLIKGVKMMKAPGRNCILMPRHIFEGNPKGYFLNLRGKTC